MVAKLDRPVDRVNWRMYSDDLALLEVLYPAGALNQFVRELVHQHCNELRQRMQGRGLGR